MRTSDYPALKKLAGRSLVVSDGTTILGADDKCGVAEIMTAAQRLMGPDAVPHGEVKICFTPDEEVGTGTLYLKPEDFGCDFAYTCDGGPFGSFQYETFNAAGAKVTVRGISTHPGSAKGVMKNAARIALEFDAGLPQGERPENTEGYEGFYHLTGMKGDVEEALLRYILRDHDAKALLTRKVKTEEIAAALNKKYGDGTVAVAIEDSYRNMGEVMKDHLHLVESAKAAITAAGGVPDVKPIRGGTDGARLSFMGIPCPNLGDGSYNGHSRMEFACVEEMDACVEVLINLAARYAHFE
ncbi:MAG TPA: peptidase T, partial [Terriglobales bacterium]|nr:peptidase T [Terriglobales bacterium]